MRKIVKLDGGATLLYHHNTQSNATAFRVGIMRGGYLDNNTGLSHLFEHMLFKGTNKYSNDQLTSLIRENFSNLNASTSGNYMIIRSYEGKKKIKDAFDISSNMLIDSTFDETELKKEKEVVRQEIIRSKDDINRIASINLDSISYNYDLLKSTTLGDEKKMMAITREQLLEYKNKNINKQNFVASVSSNFSLGTIKKYINKYFIDKLPDGEGCTFDPTEYTINCDSGIIVETIDRQKVVMKVAFPCVGFENFKDLYMLNRIFEHVSGLKGMLFRNFRENNQLVYSVYLDKWISKYDGLIVINIETSAEKVNDCFVAIKDFLTELRQGLTQEDCELIKSKLEESDDTYIGHPVNYCANMLFDYLDDKKLHSYKEYKKLRKEITANNLNDAIKKNFYFDRIFVSIAGPISKKDVMSMAKIKKLYSI